MMNSLKVEDVDGVAATTENVLSSARYVKHFAKYVARLMCRLVVPGDSGRLPCGS